MSSKSVGLIRFVLSALCACAVLLVSPSVLAVGKVEWKSKTLKETDKAWKVDVAIYLPKPPDVPTMPMKFEFQPTVYYERSLLDGDKLVERKVPLENRQALIESVDVGFLDPGSGKIEKRTKFIFKLTRGHGYEAGEYQVTIRDGRSGNVIGASTRLIFQGQNETIDRRAMVFTGNEKKKKAKSEEAKSEGESGSEGEKAADSEKAADDGSDDSAAGEASAAASSEAESSSGAEPSPPPAIKEKPGGCGCKLSGAGAGGWSAALSAALGLALFAARRRKPLRA
jgi:hypothetical protein